MMGTKGRAFGPLPRVTLEQLLPPDQFSRHLERTLDLSFVCDLVRDAYAPSGRPSIDPIAFFKLQRSQDTPPETLYLRVGFALVKQTVFARQPKETRRGS